MNCFLDNNKMNLEISLKTQNVRSFNLSENGLYSMKKKVQAVMFEGDDILCLTNTQVQDPGSQEIIKTHRKSLLEPPVMV